MVHLPDAKEQFIGDNSLSKRTPSSTLSPCPPSSFPRRCIEEEDRRGEREYISNRRLWEDSAAGRVVRRTTVDFTTGFSPATTAAEYFV